MPDTTLALRPEHLDAFVRAWDADLLGESWDSPWRLCAVHAEPTPLAGVEGAGLSVRDILTNADAPLHPAVAAEEALRHIAAVTATRGPVETVAGFALRCETWVVVTQPGQRRSDFAPRTADDPRGREAKMLVVASLDGAWTSLLRLRGDKKPLISEGDVRAAHAAGRIVSVLACGAFTVGAAAVLYGAR